MSRVPPPSAGPLPKGTTRSRVAKGPWKSRKHLDRVKAQPCLLNQSGYGWCEEPMDPHHCRKLLPGGLLPRDDRFAIPLCRKHHKMMDGAERKLWKYLGIDPAAWISSFSPEGKAAIEALQRKDAA